MVAIVLLLFFKKSNPLRKEIMPPLRFSPEKIPVSIPIRVMPICTVERNLSGLLASANASLALASPFCVCTSNLAFLADNKAISAIEKRPFKIIKPKIIKTSVIIYSVNAKLCISMIKKFIPALPVTRYGYCI